jgi:hypothetical protein
VARALPVRLGPPDTKKKRKSGALAARRRVAPLPWRTMWEVTPGRASGPNQFCSQRLPVVVVL